MAKTSAGNEASTAPTLIHDLVNLFTEHADTYRSPGYNETQLRQNFLDLFFECLGWDVRNRNEYAEAYRDVILEPGLRVEKSVRAPDYCFRISQTPKFFVEAKKPAVNIASDVGPAFQLRRYAWTAKLPLSILTDFEEFAVYDCRIKPDKNDSASTARVKLIKYTEYVERWEEIAGIFSREAILKGSFDKYAESNKKKRGTAPVDEEFLKEIESWREELAKNLSLRNPSLTDRELNTAVQLIIDRMIFLRMCEGRGIEKYGMLQALGNGTGAYGRLVEMFHRADEKYNSGLFHFQQERGREAPDLLTAELKVDDKILKEIVKRLYYPESPYEFAALPADILGQVYEQFLGKVIRLTPGHKAKIEEKPEVRKAGGVYYTPTYIVDYIVENTVGKLVEGRTPQEVGGLTATFKEAKNSKPLSVLDPACGSGSFLIVAYQYLLDWYLKQYLDSDPKSHAKGASPRLYQNSRGDWRLTIGERKRILLAHIYGVDIDYQAVEVTKLSLLLKVLEGETESTVDRILFAKERALPDLANNIKCGNSLIGSDFYVGRQRDMFDEEDELRINVFDWKGKHGFAKIFSGENPGFDAVIGNPPYVRMELFKDIKEYLSASYSAHEERADFYTYFIERGVSLLAPSGTCGMIVSNKFAVAKYGKPLRTFLRDSISIESITDFAGQPVFKGATVRTLVLIISPSPLGSKLQPYYVPVPDRNEFNTISNRLLKVSEYAATRRVKISPTQLTEGPWQLADKRTAELTARLERDFQPLKSFDIDVLFGTKTGCNEAFIVDQSTKDALLKSDRHASEVIKPILFGREIRRYDLDIANRYVIYLHPDKPVSAYPHVEAHLSAYRKKLNARATKQEWYELQQPAVKLLRLFSQPKIVYPIIAPESRFALNSHGFLINDKSFMLSTGSITLLGVLNSRLGNFFFKNVCARLEGRGECYYEFRAQFVERFPLPTSKVKHLISVPRIEALVQTMLDLKARLPKLKTPSERTTLERRIEGTDQEIDRLVYELYGLSKEEIRLVEEQGGK